MKKSINRVLFKIKMAILLDKFSPVVLYQNWRKKRRIRKHFKELHKMSKNFRKEIGRIGGF